MARCMGKMKKRQSGSDLGGLLADLLEGARRRNLSANSLAAYERTWRVFLAWAAVASLDPRALSFPTALEGCSFLGEGEERREPQADSGGAFLCLQATVEEERSLRCGGVPENSRSKFAKLS